jgi:hypothetical protein
MAEPDYEIRGQTHWERHPGGAEPNLKVDRYHLIDLNGPGGHELSICGRIIDPTCSLPLDRWETLGVSRCDATWAEPNCLDLAGEGPVKQAESEKRKPVDW